MNILNYKSTLHHQLLFTIKEYKNVYVSNWILPTSNSDTKTEYTNIYLINEKSSGIFGNFSPKYFLWGNFHEFSWMKHKTFQQKITSNAISFRISKKIQFFSSFSLIVFGVRLTLWVLFSKCFVYLCVLLCFESNGKFNVVTHYAGRTINKNNKSPIQSKY